MTFGERLVKAREQANLKQNQLAELLGITPSRLNYWEKDKREPDVLMLKKIAQNLNVSADYLIGNISNEEYSFAEQSLIKKYRLLSTKEQTAVDNLIDSLTSSSSDNTVKNNPNSEIIEKLGVDPTPENGFISHKDLAGKGIAAFGGNKKKTKF